MTTATDAPTWIRIEAPDAQSAFALERRLVHLHPSAVGRHGTWFVELEDLDDRIGEVDAAVRFWLRTTGAGEAVMHVGDERRVVVAEPAAERPLGSGYDAAGVLEHEP